MLMSLEIYILNIWFILLHYTAMLILKYTPASRNHSCIIQFNNVVLTLFKSSTLFKTPVAISLRSLGFCGHGYMFARNLKISSKQ